ncbi:MAG TPA: IS1595 family transposase [Thermoleophilaceae bacterium]|nr:IS1595 family transposase [Thermoleophilaceae bacterium]
MAAVDRNNLKRCDSSDSRISLMEFMREFPDDASCLEWLWRERFSEDGTHADCPKCQTRRAFKRYATSQRRQSWTCTGCGHHIHPTAGTIFHKSSTSLHLWFYAFYLMTSTRCGLSAKTLEREIGVNYKTAWRMLNRIRDDLMSQDGDGPLSGDVEADETAWGGKPRQGEIARIAREEGRDLSSAGGSWKQRKKKTVFAMVERGGRVRASVVPSRGRTTLHGEIVQHVLPGSTVFTDDWSPYAGIDGRGYSHRRIRHSENVYVSGDVHTQTIEGFFSNLKRGIAGTYHSVSTRWLPAYLNEYAWRYNHRNDGRSQFESLLRRAAS